MKKKGLWFLLVLLPMKLFAQELDRNFFVEKALERNYEIKIQKNKVKDAQIDSKKAKAMYIPKVGLSSAYLYTLNSLSMERDISEYQDGFNHLIENGGEAINGVMDGYQQYLQGAAAKDPNLAAALADPSTQALMGHTQGYFSQVGGELMGSLSGMFPSTLSLALNDQHLWFYDLHADMIIFSGGKIPALSKAAHEKSMALEAMVEKKEIDVIKETLDYYDRLAVVNQSLQVLADSRKRLDKQTEFAQKAVEVGLATSYDLNKIKIAEQEIKAKEIELKGSQSLLYAKLQQLTGIPVEEIRQVQPKLELWWVNIDETNTSARPEIRALDHSVMALEHKHHSEKAEYLPKAKAFAHVMHGGSDLTKIEPFAFVGVGLKWEIFDGTVRKKDIQKSQLELENMQAQKMHAEEMVALDLEKKYMEWQVSTQLVDLQEEKAEDAKEALVIRKRELENGLADTNQLLEAVTDFENARLDKIQTLHRQRVAAASLLEAMGTLDADHLQ
ncbi:TolC family protein [Sediminitomix flava]|nr:TolC family protein [Sediminitomix flava]